MAKRKSKQGADNGKSVLVAPARYVQCANSPHKHPSTGIPVYKGPNRYFARCSVCGASHFLTKIWEHADGYTGEQIRQFGWFIAIA